MAIITEELRQGIIATLQSQLPQDVVQQIQTKQEQVQALSAEIEALEGQLAGNPIYQQLEELKLAEDQEIG